MRAALVYVCTVLSLLIYNFVWGKTLFSFGQGDSCAKAQGKYNAKAQASGNPKPRVNKSTQAQGEEM